jgi:pilus assembly protein Flp/PilA
MKDMMLKCYVAGHTVAGRLRRMLGEERGQDLIEYALVVALIAFAAAAGMTTVATKINAAFTNIGTKLTTYTS